MSRKLIIVDSSRSILVHNLMIPALGLTDDWYVREQMFEPLSVIECLDLNGIMKTNSKVVIKTRDGNKSKILGIVLSILEDPKNDLELLYISEHILFSDVLGTKKLIRKFSVK